MILTDRLRSKNLTSQNQAGFAAFAVTLILMIVLALIVLGFAANSRDEQARALNTQLSTSAYYAAESGINDAYNIIKADFEAGTPIPSQTQQCLGSYDENAASGTLTPISAGAGAVAYTCLLINPTPPSLDYGPLDAGQGEVVPLFGTSSGNAAAINYITISWHEDSVPSAFTGCPTTTLNSFSSLNTWGLTGCSAGVLQVDLVSATGWTSPSLLQSDTQTVFLEPNNNGSSSPQPVTNGSVIAANCSTSTTNCSVILDGLPNSPSDPTTCSAGGCYYLHIVPIYDNADINITASVSPSSTGQLDMNDAQAVIDSTGKSGDELKRIEEHVSINPVGNNNVPVNAIQSLNGVCKEFTTRPGNTSFVANC